MQEQWLERASRVLLDNYFPPRLSLVRGAGVDCTARARLLRPSLLPHG